MPVQHTCFGRPVPLQMPPRRFQLLFALILFLIVTLTLYGPPVSENTPTNFEQVKETLKNPHIPKLPQLPTYHSPFGMATHKPPTQEHSNSTSSYGLISWFSDFKWRNPFSSSVTLDPNRAILPPLKDRPYIYTYYDPQEKQADDVTEAENRLLLAWRRAWWAQGFLPQVLSRAEAMKNPQYQFVQRMNLDSKTESEVMRWLAWGFMGSGILTNYLALPMAAYNDPLFTFLRRKEYPELTRIQALQNAVFYGEGTAINSAIKKALDDPIFKDTKANADKIKELSNKDGGIIVNLLPEGDLKAETKSDAIAYYSKETLSSNYKVVADKLSDPSKAEALDELATLINSHLHLTFQNVFSDGIAILKPLPEHTTALTHTAIDIARNLTQCPTSPIPSSCPPNRKCTPCDPTHPKPLRLLQSYKNDSSLYTIGTVPHPYTLLSLHYSRDEIDGAFLRRSTKRDQWILEATKEILGPDVSEAYRIVQFKEAVATPFSASNSLWLTAERESQDDLDWIFGFALPRTSSPVPAQSKPLPGPQPRPGLPTPLKDVQVPDEKLVGDEEARLRKAREAIGSQDRRMRSVVEEVEAWNLVDTEAWRFARSWSARRRVEREEWEKGEGRFAGTEKKAGVHNGGGGKGRWSD